MRWQGCRVAGCCVLALVGGEPPSVSSADAPIRDVAEPAAAGPAADGSFPDSIETLEVLGRREALRQHVKTFVMDMTRGNGEFVARWKTPVCPWVSGVPAGQVSYVRTRLARVAVEAGVPFDDDAACRTNLYVFFTDEPAALVRQLRNRNSRFFTTSTGSTSHITPSTPAASGPVQAWYVSDLHNADGTEPIEYANKSPHFRLENSRISGRVTLHLAAALIVVDVGRASTASLGQITDFVAMTAFAMVDLDRRFVGQDTVLRLFERPGAVEVQVAGQPRPMGAATTPPATTTWGTPAGLTAWDWAFLSALYGTDQANTEQRALIEASMARALAR